MKRVSTRAIIFIDDKIALIYRNKFENIYYSLPGGGVEENETLEEATIREVKEELNLDVEVLEYLGSFEDEVSIQHFYHCKNIGKIDLKIIGEEKERNTKENYYEPVLVNISNIDNIEIRFKDIIKKAIKKEYL
ncbi:MAG: NUDIX domain-containing protein [Bacilli bacterium]|nr:NUDIX domain-containing protein [Bacilli bacterium]